MVLFQRGSPALINDYSETVCRRHFVGKPRQKIAHFSKALL
jgi:hypothetical protein